MGSVADPDESLRGSDDSDRPRYDRSAARRALRPRKIMCDDGASLKFCASVRVDHAWTTCPGFAPGAAGTWPARAGGAARPATASQSKGM